MRRWPAVRCTKGRCRMPPFEKKPTEQHATTQDNLFGSLLSKPSRLNEEPVKEELKHTRQYLYDNDYLWEQEVTRPQPRGKFERLTAMRQPATSWQIDVPSK